MPQAGLLEQRHDLVPEVLELLVVVDEPEDHALHTGLVEPAQLLGDLLSLLTSSVLKAPGPDHTDFATLQHAQIETFRAAHPAGDDARVSQGLVVIPTDTATPEQRAKYAAYVDARTPRTARPQGPANMLFAPDILGTSEQIIEALYAHAGFRDVREVVFALPFGFDHADYVQILTDMATRLGPALGWAPRG